jgi:hypothetical protein
MVQQFADLAVRLQGMTQRHLGANLIRIASPNLGHQASFEEKNTFEDTSPTRKRGDLRSLGYASGCEKSFLAVGPVLTKSACACNSS